MTDAGAASSVDLPKIERLMTLGAVALSLVYALVVIAIASPVSFYTLDDPYIHMALAENIARGHFGVNLGEYSNPSSSIAWPWLLAAFEKLGVMLYAPLFVNVACFVASVRVMTVFCLKRVATDSASVLNALLALGLALLAFNVFGVIFTGMEHSLHVLLSVVAVTRVIDGKYDRLTLVVLALGPLVRFEGAIVLALGVGATLVDRRFAFAAIAIAAAALPVALYAGWLSSLGLPVLPSSVLSKSAAAGGMVDGGGGVMAGLLATLGKNATSPAAPLLGVMVLGLVYAAMKRSGRDRVLAGGLIAVLLLAMMLGRMDSYARYEVYVLCVLGLGLAHLLQGELRRLMASRVRALSFGLGLCLLGALLGPYVIATTPQAARNIERQQYQIHRLAECWKKPVAVNDLGWASFRNDAHVLDLYGLGSETARKARAAGEPGWMARLADAHDVELVMIYQDWFPERPADWLQVGAIVDLERQVTPYANAVQVFVTRADAVAAVRKCLNATARPQGPAMVVLQDT